MLNRADKTFWKTFSQSSLLHVSRGSCDSFKNKFTIFFQMPEKWVKVDSSSNKK